MSTKCVFASFVIMKQEDKSMLPIPTHLKDILIVDESKIDANSICGTISCTCGCGDMKLKIYANERKGYIGVKKY